MKARKKPVIVDVVQLPELNEYSIDHAEWLTELWEAIPYLKKHNVVLWNDDEFDSRLTTVNSPIKYGYVINSLEGKMKAAPGDYLVYGGNDDIWAIKKDIFEQTYEIIEEN